MRLASTARRFAAVTAAGPAALLLVAAAEAPAQDGTAAQIEQRQEQMKKLSRAAKAIGGYVKGEGGTADDVQAAAADIHEVAANLVELFPEGTAMGVAEGSYAKPEIWHDWPAFEERVEALEPAAEQMMAAAESGERAEIAAALKQVGDACGGCHERFRQKKPEQQ